MSEHAGGAPATQPVSADPAGRALGCLFLAAAVPVLAFSDEVGLAVVGVLVWGAATGLQDSTVKALVAQLVPAGPPGRLRAFAAVQGPAAVVGGALAGALSTRSAPALVAIVAVLQRVALMLLLGTLRNQRA